MADAARYDPETVRRILARALDRHRDDGALDHDALRALAAELDIDDAALSRAIEAESRALAAREANARAITRSRGLAVLHVILYAVVTLALFVLARRIAVALLVLWGIGAVSHLFSAWRRDDGDA